MQPQTSNLKPKQETSSGGCVYKVENGQVFWLLGKHSGYHKWVLPKGLIEAGETPEETAVRETREELAVTAKVISSKPIHTIHYTYQAWLKDKPANTRRVDTYQEDTRFSSDEAVLIDKTVHFFLMEYVAGDESRHGWEMEAAGWYSFEEALVKLAFDGEREALSIAHKIVKENLV
jgi:8-oxo-dGTP pyrophosphatase MutT (NUDIX family)